MLGQMALHSSVQLSKYSLSYFTQEWKHSPPAFITPPRWLVAGNGVFHAMPISFPLHCKFIPSFSTIFHTISNSFAPNSQAAESTLLRAHQASQPNRSVPTTAPTVTNIFAVMPQPRSRPEGDSHLHDDPRAKISRPKLNAKAPAEPHVAEGLVQPARFRQRQERMTAGDPLQEDKENKRAVLILSRCCTLFFFLGGETLKIKHLFCITDIISFQNKKPACGVTEVNGVSATPCKC